MPEVFLHLGLHKTASGTLQRQFFPACSDLDVFTTIVPEMKVFVELVTRKDPIYFDADRVREVIYPILSKQKANLLSNESFSGPPYAGGFEYGLDHRSSVISNLKAVFPNAKVILVLRRQDALSRSLYRQYLKSGGTRSVRRFYGMDRDGRLPIMSLDRFFYSSYVDAVKALFPAGVLLLAFEEFAEDQAAFLRKITDFIGVKFPSIPLRKENATRLGPFGMEVSRVLNHLFRSYLNPGGILPGVPVFEHGERRLISPMEILHDKWPGKGGRYEKSDVFTTARDIFEMVREDNRVLDSKNGLSLDRYGYYG